MNRSIYHDGRVFHVNAPCGNRGGWYLEVSGADPRSQNSKETEG